MLCSGRIHKKYAGVPVLRMTRQTLQERRFSSHLCLLRLKLLLLLLLLLLQLEGRLMALLHLRLKAAPALLFLRSAAANPRAPLNREYLSRDSVVTGVQKQQHPNGNTQTTPTHTHNLRRHRHQLQHHQLSIPHQHRQHIPTPTPHPQKEY